MNKRPKIALIGDYNPNVTAHVAIPLAIKASAREPVEHIWISTESLHQDVEEKLGPFDGIWCVPASPYKNMQGALDAIRFARETDRPYLGTCGGYQHSIIEYARNVLGISNPAHAEVDPGADTPLIAPLSCAMVEHDGEILFHPNTRIRKIYGTEQTTETYHCSYGFNRAYAHLFGSSGLVISAVNQSNEPHAIEIPAHFFFIATAYQPERCGLRNEPHH